jgi:tetratricopeptide (TPR) repeat protein
LAIPLLASAVSAASSSIEDAFALQHQGKLKEARDLFRAIATNSRASGDKENSAKALSAAGNISVSLGDYSGAISDAQQAIELRQGSKKDEELATDYNTLGRANQYLGNYPAALDNYQTALGIDRAVGGAAGEITRLNNIGNIYYFQGQYSPALDFYQQALVKVNATTTGPWNPWARQLTSANMATVYQRVGLEGRALDLYKEISSKAQALSANEQAQLLLNEGVLYRRMGDPIKALELYSKAQALFRSDRQADGAIGALRNIGIAKAMDLGDLAGSLDAFTAALELAKRSSNTRGLVQASLYRGDVLRRLHRPSEAKTNLDAAFDGAQKAGLIEEQWKSLYALGRTAEDAGATEGAATDYRKAIAIIDSIRAGLRATSLRNDFLADKRDVYDALISLQLQQSVPTVSEIFQWMERSRARTLLDRMAAHTPLQEFSLEEIQAHLPQDTVLIEFWVSNQSSAAVWLTRTKTGLVRYGSTDDIRQSVEVLLAGIQGAANQWREPSRSLGNQLLAGIPLERHLLVVPDGPLSIPFEILGVPNSDSLLIEKCDASFLPSARFVAMPKMTGQRWLFPWNQQMTAFGNPPVFSSDALAVKEGWQPLPASEKEVRGIAGILPGRAEIHLGADARKTYLVNHRPKRAPLLHFSTHAMVDAENPDRSRILLAADSSNGADYVFLDEVYSLDLKNVDLVTVSACDTARGKMVRGEGIQAFSQAFLAAGSSATVTSLWKVADEPTADFMKQFYYSLARGATKAEALQAAKLQFFRSPSELSNPRYWAAFVMNGDGWNSSRRVIPWSALVFAVAAIFGMAAAFLRQLARSRLRR